MSTLTAEQRKRIEENRQKALQKRADILKNRENGNANIPVKIEAGATTTEAKAITKTSVKIQSIAATTDANISTNSVSSISYPIFKNKLNESSSLNNNKFANTFYKSQDTFYKSQDTFYKSQDTLKKSKSIEKPTTNSTFSGNKMNGNFFLMTKDRFIVNVPYHAQTIEIFKTIQSRQYDTQSKKWNFNISDHSKLSSALKQLRPEVCISPLPTYVLQAIKKTSTFPKSETINLLSLDPSLLEAFLPFQREGVCFGVSRAGRALIADDMGLGKTLQALGIASYYRDEWPLLVVAPSSVRYSWVESICRWVGSVTEEDICIVNTGKDSLDGLVVVLSYDLLARRASQVASIGFKVVIMDESHMLKNFKSQRYKCALPIMRSTRRLIMLSGTPALSRPSELYTQLSALDAKLFPNFQDYGIRYCAGRQQPWGWDFSGSSNLEEVQVILETTYMIRRLKDEVLTQLPSKQRMTIFLSPTMVKTNSGAMRAATRQLRGAPSEGGDQHGALLLFFRETAVAKVDAVCEYIKELLTEGDKKFLVFAHHTVMMNKISETCDEQKVHYIRIDGSTSSESRQRLVDYFQKDAQTRVAVLSITAASTGITLTAAQLVVFAELYWNPGPLVQAEDRAHRIGQADSVLVQYLIAKGTADDYIWSLVKGKMSTLKKAGLSKDDFGAADSADQKIKLNDGIMKYFTELKDEDIANVDEGETSNVVLKRKRKESDND